MSTHRLAGSKEIALTVSEPGALTKQFALAVSDLGDVVDRPQARNVVFLEHHSAPSQPLHGRLDVFYLPRHLSSVLSWGGAARLEEHELRLTTAVEQTSGPLFTRFETQLLCVERPGPLQILCRDPRRDLAVFKHSNRPPSYRVALDGNAARCEGRRPPNGGYYCGPGGDPRGRLSRSSRRTRVLLLLVLTRPDCQCASCGNLAHPPSSRISENEPSRKLSDTVARGQLLGLRVPGVRRHPAFRRLPECLRGNN